MKRYGCVLGALVTLLMGTSAFAGGGVKAGDTYISTMPVDNACMAVEKTSGVSLAGGNNKWGALQTDGSGNLRTSGAATVAVLGNLTDDKSTATDTTSVSAISLLKEISAQVQTLGGAVVAINSRCVLTSAATTNSTSCKASAGNLTGVSLVNTTATTYYLRLYNSASAPTCSSATGFIESIPILATGGIAYVDLAGEAYSTGIGFCLTANGASTDNNAAATGVYVKLLYN